MAHARNLRKGRLTIDNGIYLATFVVKNRRPLFSDMVNARTVIRCINQSPFVITLAFVVMPDHVHWLIKMNTAKTLSQVVQAAKSVSSRAINRVRGGKGTIWQAGFHDHALRHEEAMREIARYIVANPLRAKLVKKVGDYPHWDAIWINNEHPDITTHLL
jgi:REP element-mobilizing transposase RayT